MKIISLEDAVKYVKSGDKIGVGHAMAEPKVILNKLTERSEELSDIEIIHMISVGENKYMEECYQKSFRHNSLFVGVPARKLVKEGRADFTPCHFSKIPELFNEKLIELDIAFIQVSEPDAHGHVSLGVSVDYTKSIAQNARLVIAQINKNMPRTHGESFLHVNEIDYGVVFDEELPELKRPVLSEEEMQIGKYCAKLIRDRDTLQLGIGSLPDAVLLMLTEKKDLGIHSELISDGVMDLVKKGVITNKYKTIHKNKIIATFIMGTKELYDFIDDNPILYMAPSNYVNDPSVICQNNNLVSINSCVQIDITGQICAESVGRQQISATGGQVDFIRGANMSKGGISIIAITSTTKNGTISKIVDVLDEGAVVTTSRNDVNYIVTENGIACLKGKTLRDRGRELIKVAHENFKEELIIAWEKRYKCKY